MLETETHVPSQGSKSHDKSLINGCVHPSKERSLTPQHDQMVVNGKAACTWTTTRHLMGMERLHPSPLTPHQPREFCLFPLNQSRVFDCSWKAAPFKQSTSQTSHSKKTFQPTLKAHQVGPSLCLGYLPDQKCHQSAASNDASVIGSECASSGPAMLCRLCRATARPAVNNATNPNVVKTKGTTCCQALFVGITSWELALNKACVAAGTLCWAGQRSDMDAFCVAGH